MAVVQTIHTMGGGGWLKLETKDQMTRDRRRHKTHERERHTSISSTIHNKCHRTLAGQCSRVIQVFAHDLVHVLGRAAAVPVNVVEVWGVQAVLQLAAELQALGVRAGVSVVEQQNHQQKQHVHHKALGHRHNTVTTQSKHSQTQPQHNRNTVTTQSQQSPQTP